eukprot:14010627-Alexandrium_andersonii.AAC.1
MDWVCYWIGLIPIAPSPRGHHQFIKRAVRSSCCWPPSLTGVALLPGEIFHRQDCRPWNEHRSSSRFWVLIC